MTEGMLLHPEQIDIFEIYRLVFFGDPKVSLDGKTLTSVTEILKKHPELKKQHFQEFEIRALEKVFETPKTLERFIKSQITTAGQIRNNLFQIESNLSFWKKFQEILVENPLAAPVVRITYLDLNSFIRL